MLDAAARIVQRSGAGHLTIDAVAAEAGVSKGGVLYHFPSKRALLTGMLERLMESISSRAASHEASMNGEPSAAIRARILGEYDRDREERALSMAILAASAEDPGLIEPARCEASRAFEDVVRDSPNPDLATILLLATEGLRFMDMLDLTPMTAKQRSGIRDAMLRLAGASE